MSLSPLAHVVKQMGLSSAFVLVVISNKCSILLTLKRIELNEWQAERTESFPRPKVQRRGMFLNCEIFILQKNVVDINKTFRRLL
jgi:hypothetical protein